MFAKEGAAVVIADVLQNEGEAVAADIRASQGQATFVTTDVTSEAAWEKLIAATITTYGRLDILVNNAGISGSSVGDEVTLAGWEKLMAALFTKISSRPYFVIVAAISFSQAGSDVTSVVTNVA